MKYFQLFSLIILLLVTSACQPDNSALGRVQSTMNSYQAGDGNAFEQQLTHTLRQSSPLCPAKLQYSCLQIAYKNFATTNHSSAQSPQSFTFTLYDKQTTPNVKMVLVEGNWGGSPALTSCQVFFVITDDKTTWLIDNFDTPQAMNCQQRSKELTENLFGTSGDATPKP